MKVLLKICQAVIDIFTVDTQPKLNIYEMFILSLESHMNKLWTFSLGWAPHRNIFRHVSVTCLMHDTDVFRTLSDEDGAFCENS